MMILRVIRCAVLVYFCSEVNGTEKASTYGKHFLFGIPKTVTEKGQNYIDIHISTYSKSATTVTIYAPCIGYISNVSASNTIHSIPEFQLVQQEAGSDNKGIEVVSDEDISVTVGVHYSSRDNEGLLGFPVELLSTRYIVASYQPYNSFNSSILVVGVTNNTDIEITYSTNGINKLTERARLQKFETYQVLSSNDLRGAVVTSTKPVAVFSGSERSKIPVGEGQENNIVEQMIPTQFWTNEYIVPPIYPHHFNLVRIFADHDNTVVNHYNRTHNDTTYLSQGMMAEIMFGAEPAVIFASKPISVVQYFVDNENMYGNPFMIVLQGLSQFTHLYTFSTPATISAGSYSLVITILKNMSDGILLNGNKLHNWEIEVVPVPEPLHDYVAIYYNLTSGHNTLEHKNGFEFGALLNSQINAYYGYGITLALTLSRNISTERPVNASDTCNHGSTFVPDYQTSSPNSFQTATSTTGMYSSTRHVLSSNGNKTWCFQCDDMAHLQYCDAVRECLEDDEVCFVQRYTKNGFIQLYKSGCKKKSMCQTIGVDVDCQQCCNGNFCNTDGWGDNEVPPIGNRGPYCFACGHLGENDVFRTVQMCAPGQMCKTEMYVWGSGHHYIKGCVDQEKCQSKRSMFPNYRRSTPACLSCCHEDFCNTNNCTETHGVALIG